MINPTNLKQEGSGKCQSDSAAQQFLNNIREDLKQTEDDNSNHVPNAGGEGGLVSGEKRCWPEGNDSGSRAKQQRREDNFLTGNWAGQDEVQHDNGWGPQALKSIRENILRNKLIAISMSSGSDNSSPHSSSIGTRHRGTPSSGSDNSSPHSSSIGTRYRGTPSSDLGRRGGRGLPPWDLKHTAQEEIRKSGSSLTGRRFEDTSMELTKEHAKNENKTPWAQGHGDWHIKDTTKGFFKLCEVKTEPMTIEARKIRNDILKSYLNLELYGRKKLGVNQDVSLIHGGAGEDEWEYIKEDLRYTESFFKLDEAIHSFNISQLKREAPETIIKVRNHFFTGNGKSSLFREIIFFTKGIISERVYDNNKLYPARFKVACKTIFKLVLSGIRVAK